MVLVEYPNVMLATIDYTISYYILWGFTSSLKLCYYKDVCLYFGLEEPHHDLEFELTLVGYDEQGNVLSYHMELVSISKVI